MAGTSNCIARISQESPELMAPSSSPLSRPKATRRFQLKVGGDPMVDIERIRRSPTNSEPGDAPDRRRPNMSWLMHDALRVVRDCMTWMLSSNTTAVQYDEGLRDRAAIATAPVCAR